MMITPFDFNKLFNTLAELPELIESLKYELIELKEAHTNKNPYTTWMTLKNAAKYLEYSESHFRRMLAEGKLAEGKHFYQTHGKILFDRVALDNWVKGLHT